MRWRLRSGVVRAGDPDLGERVGAFRTDAKAALAAGDLDAAMEALGQAALLRPWATDLHVELGGVMRRAGRIEAARLAYRRALEIDPAHPEARTAVEALPPEPPKRSNFRVGQFLQSARGSAGGGLVRYEVLKVRNGGFGAVYIVRDSETEKWSALKSFDARLLWSDDDRRRFLIEATTWINLDPHPHVVTARWAETIEGFPCLVMDYVDGGDLGDRLAEGPLSVAMTIRLGIQLCDGMEHARSRSGIVHRDLKPSNCMLGRDGDLKITDFGLARALRHAQEASTGLSDKRAAGVLYTTVAGTPSYMAPEQFVLGAPLDTRVDVFAFGVMLCQMLTGEVPAVGQAHRYAGGLRAGGRVPRGLANLAARCADPDPDRRPATFGDIREELARMYRRATRAAAPPPPVPGGVDPYTWVDRSIAFRHLDLPDQAVVAADRGLDLAAAGDDRVLRGHLWQVRGLALVDLDRRAEALECYDRALEFIPGEPSAWVCKGAVLSELGRHEEGLSCYDQCLSLMPDHPTALRNKASTLTDVGRLDEAEAEFRRAAQFIPRDVELLVNWVDLLQAQERHEEALPMIERALAIAPRDEYAWFRFGQLLISMGRTDDAMAAYERSLEINPRYTRAWDFLGFAFAGAGRFTEALVCYDRALTFSPDHARIWFRRAVTLSGLDRIDEALESCDRALSLDPHCVDAQELRGRLPGRQEA